MVCLATGLAISPAMKDYDVFQQVFKISNASNLVRECRGKASELQKKLAERIPKELATIGPSTWEVVWGPVVWKEWPWHSNTKQGNAWFVAKTDSVVFEDGQAYPTYVISIAGTAGQYDIIWEDAACGKVNHVDEWASAGLSGLKEKPKAFDTKPPTSTDPALISNGFGQAVFHILNSAPPLSATGVTAPLLGEFLQSVALSQPTAKLVFTGHSLGGALAPLLAYSLVQAKVFPPENVLVYPTAGPSPGNALFGKQFRAYFPPPTGELVGYQHWNVNITNPFDVVPCGYCMDASATSQILQNVAAMYGIPTVPNVDNKVGILQKRAQNVYYPLVSSTFESPIPKPATAPTSTKEFLGDAIPQHVDAYTKFIGIETGKALNTWDDVEDLLGYPVLGNIAAAEVGIKGGNEDKDALSDE